MSIRRAQTQDIPDILRLLVQVNMVHHKARPDLFKGPATKYSAAELEEILRDDEKPVFVYTEGDKFLGYIFCQTEICEESPLRTGIWTLYIDDLCVDEKVRGRAIGKQLFEFVKAYARENGCHNLTLNVWEGNDPAISFYRNMGMKVQKTGMETIL